MSRRPKAQVMPPANDAEPAAPVQRPSTLSPSPCSGPCSWFRVNDWDRLRAEGPPGPYYDGTQREPIVWCSNHRATAEARLSRG